MKSQLRIEVEPLSEHRWARIERSLMDRAEGEPLESARSVESERKYPGLRPWLAAAVVMSALAVMVFAFRWLPTQATLDHPSRITTGPSASHLALPGLTLDVEPESAVVVGAETGQGMLLVLDRGSIVCRVAPRSSEAPLIVQAGAARVRLGAAG